MKRFFPLAKGGAVGFVMVLLYPLLSIAQTDSPKSLYRLEKIENVQCNFGTSRLTVKTGNTEDLEFRIGGNGDFYFITYVTGKIWHFDGTGKLIRTVSVGALLTRRSTGFTRSPEGDLFLLDGRQKKLYRYDASLDLIGKYSVIGPDELESVCGFAATSWGELLASGGLRSGIWKLEPEGHGFSAKPVYLPENHSYSFLSEMEREKLSATDPLGELMVMDRYGNLLRMFSFRKGLRAVPVGENFLTTFWPYTELMVLDTSGVILADWKTVELDSFFNRVFDFQVLRDKAYFLLPSLGKILGFHIVRSDSVISPEGRQGKK